MVLDGKHTLALRCREREPSTPQADLGSWLAIFRGRLIKIGAKVVRHGRYVTFQLAEVAIPRRLFAEILRPNDGLPPTAAPTSFAVSSPQQA